MKHLLQGLIYFFIISNLAFAIDIENKNEKITDLSNLNSKQSFYFSSLADIIEPLMPAVVNIYTVKYNKRPDSGSNALQELLPFNNFSEFFEQFNIPFSFEDLYSNPRAFSLGSGFIIDEKGYIVTNYHVIAGSDETHIKLADNTELPATLIGTDSKTDLALLKIESNKKLPYVGFGSSSKTRVGDVVIAIGNPLGLGGTVTTGIISSKGRDLAVSQDELVDNFLQTDAAINVGSSGSPLFDLNGKVIGVNTSIPAIGDGTNIGIGFAIPSETVEDIVGQLKEKGKINRGQLDVMIQEITPELAEAFGIGEPYGVLVIDVKPGGVGDKAGLKQGDFIIEYNGNKVLNSRKLKLFVADTHIGKEVEITVLRNKNRVKFKAKILLTEESNNKTVEGKHHITKKSNVVFSNLSDNLINKYNLNKNNKGVIVISIKPNNVNCELTIGDLVIAVDQQHIENIEQFNTEYEKAKSLNKKSVVLLIKRRDFTRFAALPIK